MKKKTEPIKVEKMLINIRDIAIILDVSERTVRRMNDAGRLPEPIQLGGLLKWKKSSIYDWIDLNCPTRLCK